MENPSIVPQLCSIGHVFFFHLNTVETPSDFPQPSLKVCGWVAGPTPALLQTGSGEVETRMASPFESSWNLRRPQVVNDDNVENPGKLQFSEETDLKLDHYRVFFRLQDRYQKDRKDLECTKGFIEDPNWPVVSESLWIAGRIPGARSIRRSVWKLNAETSVGSPTFR